MAKHIAMWTCARSRSTLVTRAFQQQDGCLIFDEPLYPPYACEFYLGVPISQEEKLHRWLIELEESF